MNAYRVKAHALDRELDATRERLSKSRASHKKVISERDQTIAGLQVAINEMHIRAVDSEAGFPCIAERDATIASLRSSRDDLLARNAAWMEWSKGLVGMQASDADARMTITGLTDKRVASIVAFLERQADAKRESWSRPQSDTINDIATQIARGDDMLGGE